MEHQAIAKGKTLQADKRGESRGGVRAPARESSASGTAHLLRLQRSLGNRALGRFLQANPKVGATVRNAQLKRKCACGNHAIDGEECAECAKKKRSLQRQLIIGGTNDPLEQEAERVAEQVLARPIPSAVGGAPPHIQRYARQATESSDTAPASVDGVLASPGRPLEPALRQDMEERFGHDFSRVRVHTGAAAEQSTRDVNANAYTVGHNVVFGSGRYSPGTQEGRRLIAHELTHVVQQSMVDGFPAFQASEQRNVCPASMRAQSRALSLFPNQGIRLIQRQAPVEEPPPRPMPRRPPPLRIVPRPAPPRGRQYTPRRGRGSQARPEIEQAEKGTEDLPFYAEEEILGGQTYYDAAKAAAEFPVATFERGGSPPDFIVLLPEEHKRFEDIVDPITGYRYQTPPDATVRDVACRPAKFHILDAIEYDVGRAKSNDDLKAILSKYMDIWTPAAIPILVPFRLPDGLDPNATKRLEIYSAAAGKRRRSVPALDPALDPTLVVPEDLPEEAKRRGCTSRPGRFLFDPRFDVHNWFADVWCRSAIDSLFEYDIYAPNGRDHAMYDGKRGAVVYECKCGYESIRHLYDFGTKQQAMALTNWRKIEDQLRNHKSVADACGLRLTYKVSSAALAQELRKHAGISVHLITISGFDTSSCAP